MKILKLSLFVCTLIFALSSCLQLGINLKHRTPRKASVLPVFSRKDSLLGAALEKRICFDVHHYDVHLRIDPEKKSIQGFVTTSFSLVKPATNIQLDLAANLQIDSITSQNQHLKFKRELTAVYIDLPSKAAHQSLTIYYQGRPHEAKRPPWDGGIVWKKDKTEKPLAGIACEGDGAHLWLPVKILLADEPDSADLHFTVPPGLVAVSNGVLVNRRMDEQGETFHWKTRYPINTYNMTFYLGAYQLKERVYKSTSGKLIPQQFWVTEEHAAAAAYIFNYTDTVLRCYEELYGEYPWQTEPYKLVESAYEGMEHQTAIAYGRNFNYKPDAKFNYIIVHETAHEWWGNSVSVADFSDVWIHEGFATYSEALYVERLSGHAAYLRYMRNISYSILNKKPVIGPEQVYYWDYKDGDVYMKGAATLHALRCALSEDPLFFRILREFYQQHRMGQATTQQFIELANTMSGRKLNFIFDQYLYQRSSPKLVWTISPIKDSNEEEFLYRFENTVPGFAMPIQINAGEKEFIIYPDGTNQSLRLPAGSKKLLQINALNIYLQKAYLKLRKFKKV